MTENLYLTYKTELSGRDFKQTK